MARKQGMGYFKMAVKLIAQHCDIHPLNIVLWLLAPVIEKTAESIGRRPVNV